MTHRVLITQIVCQYVFRRIQQVFKSLFMQVYSDMYGVHEAVWLIDSIQLVDDWKRAVTIE
jgi:hypothetical protein